jgi:hypothetical protein
MGDRGWAGALLAWRWDGLLLRSEVSVARYFIRGDRHEILAWAELRDLAGRRRIEVGTFGAVAAARAACEADVRRRIRRDDAEARAAGPVEVRISPSRRRRARARAPVVARDPRADLDEALRAFADVIEE